MVLMRAPLGERGSYVPTTVNLLQCIGWTVFELLVIATAAAALSDELFGFGAQWLWTLVFGGARAGPRPARPGRRGAARRADGRRMGRAAGARLPRLVGARRGRSPGGVGRPGEGGLSVWQGADIVVAVTVSWIPLAADYTRFSRSPRTAFWGTGVGYFVPDLLLLSLGAVLLFTRDVTDAAALPACRRGRWRRRVPRAARADGGRDGRGVCERLLGRRLEPEPVSVDAAARRSS